MSECPSFESLVEGEANPEHLETCPPCADAWRDVTAMRAEARRLGSRAWCNPAPQLDELQVERALAAVLGQAQPTPRRAASFFRFTSRAAAALLLAGFGAPYVLETRKSRDHEPTAVNQAAQHVFWTTQLVTARK